MYDSITTQLIRSTPPLEGLDRDALAERLSEAFARIAVARLRLRAREGPADTELNELVCSMRRLALTNEALVALAPDRADRAAAAFVAASAHQICFNAARLNTAESQTSSLTIAGITSDISALLLFLIAESPSDAAEIARHVAPPAGDSIEDRLIKSLRYLAVGNLRAITDANLPVPESIQRDSAPATATAALYRSILEGVRVLASALLSRDALATEPPRAIFRRVRELCIPPRMEIVAGAPPMAANVYAGPFHLASLLIAVAEDLLESSLAQIPPPGGIDATKWRQTLTRLAGVRPYLWRNHREAIKQQYLELGVSSVVGFPTGAGKSTLAELKIAATLLADKKVVFLAPTHALADQTMRSLRRSFPSSKIRSERFDELEFYATHDELPAVLVMTPEACLMQLSVDSSTFEDVGLLVFDECHLLHPKDSGDDRRAVDAMLCLLTFTRKVPDADLLLLSAMMKNTSELSEWISERTGRPCLALSLAWKPTRQLRGCTVYEQDSLRALQVQLGRSHKKSTNKRPPQTAKAEMTAQPLGLFSLQQTWLSNSTNDYALLPLLDEPIKLGTGGAKPGRWYLTPNAGEASAAIAAAASGANLKTLIFFQTIRNATSTAKKVAKRLGAVELTLNESELAWAEIAALELGGPKHLYVPIADEKCLSLAAVHHGLLLPEERYLCESLYRRSDGIRVLTATSTLAQGMNLPSELVIIAEDSRFDATSTKREVLEAQELLNAAGRAGRAGENATGVVIVIPGSVVGIDWSDAAIGSRWKTLQSIFEQSDQCLDIDDPLTAVLDRVHSNLTAGSDLDRYVLSRLAACGQTENDSETLGSSIRSSLAAFRARRQKDEAWIESRIRAATQSFTDESPIDQESTLERQVATALGVPLGVTQRLSDALASLDSLPTTTTAWVQWFFAWMATNPDLVDSILRPQTVDSLLGRDSTAATDAQSRARAMLPTLYALTDLWMQGAPLAKLEVVLDPDESDPKTCDNARKFVLRVIPELTYAFSLPALLARRKAADGEEAAILPIALQHLGRCVRYGFDRYELVGLSSALGHAHLSRRRLHQNFASLEPYLKAGQTNETWNELTTRLETAMIEELNNRGSGY